MLFNLSSTYANINTAKAIWGLKNFEKQNTNAQTTEDWNKQNINSPIIQYGNLQYNTADPNNILLFRFGKRPLGWLPWMGTLSDNPTSNDLNIEISHEHGFFEDGTGDNIGFWPDGRLPEDPKDLINMEYRYEDKHYEDDIMREALDNVIDGEYNIFTNNCQHWADSLREKYEKLKKENQR